MSGFDNVGVDKAFFSGTRIQSNFICSIATAIQRPCFRAILA
jgi:hypothetical protein